MGEFGGRDRARTGDPLLAKQVLSQLSYTPTAPFYSSAFHYCFVSGGVLFIARMSLRHFSFLERSAFRGEANLGERNSGDLDARLRS